MNVFYADDDAEDQEIFCAALEEINPLIKVILSKDGQAVLEDLGTSPQSPDFIFLDINMPRMNGIECLTRLKSIDRLKNVPVIIFSTSQNEHELSRLKAIGAEDFLSKSTSFDSLRDSIQKILMKDAEVDQ